MSHQHRGFSGVVAEVNANHQALVTLPQSATDAGFARLLDSDGHEIITTENGALSTSIDNLLFFEQVDGATLNTNSWATSVSTMAIAQASGFITLNSAGSVAAGAYAVLNTIKNFPFYGHLPNRVSINAKVNVQPQANLTMELGIGLASGNSAPTDGLFFRWNSSAQFVCVINNGGSETSSGALSGTFTEADGSTVTVPVVNNQCHLFDIVIVEDVAQFLVDDVLVAEVDVPSGLAYPTNAGRLPLFARVYNGGSAPSAAPQLSIGQVVVVQEGMTLNRPWGETLAALGRGAYQSPVTAFAQTANHVNSTSPTSATLSNTTAGYATLGGRFQFAAVAGAATDFALFAFQVPAGYQFFVTSVMLSLLNTGAIGSAITPSLFDWSVGVNSSAVSLATADGAGTWAPRRIPIGNQAYGLSAVVGAMASDIVRNFLPPLVVDSGRYFHIILQCPVGAATASQIFRGDCLITGYFE